MNGLSELAKRQGLKAMRGAARKAKAEAARKEAEARTKVEDLSRRKHEVGCK